MKRGSIIFLSFALALIAIGLQPAGVQAATRVRPATPVKIIIPRIGVNATIEARGLTRQGFMQVPSGPGRVAWYRTGTVPGNPGDAVMYGHLTDNHFNPAVFARLNKLRIKDRITVIDARGNTHIFRVTKLDAYKYSQMTFHQLAGPTKYSHLNLYTCAGHWSPSARRYTHFLIVYTTLVSSTPPR